MTGTSFTYTENWSDVSSQIGNTPAMLLTDAATSAAFIITYDNWVSNALPAMMDFKAPGYFKVQACNSVGCSADSVIDAGYARYSHTSSSSEVAQLVLPMVAYPVIRTMSTSPTGMDAINYCGMDLCGNIGGMIMSRGAIDSSYNPSVHVYYENYTVGSNASSDANMVLDGYIGGQQTLANALDGVLAVSGDVDIVLPNGEAVSVTAYAKVDMSAGENTGYATVTYDGNAYNFTLPITPTNGQSTGTAVVSASSTAPSTVTQASSAYPTPFQEAAPPSSCLSNETTVIKDCTRIQ